MPDLSTQQRNVEIVRLYNEGMPSTELAERFEVTRQRISQILRASEAVAPSEARAARADRRQRELDESVQDFLTQHGPSLEALVSAGATRHEADVRFQIMAPEFSEATRDAALRAPHLVFDVDREEYLFDQVMVEIGLWCALARQNNLVGDASTALSELTLTEMTEFSDILGELGASSAQIKALLMAAAAARAQVRNGSQMSITKNAYDQQRLEIVADLGLSEGRGGFAWPPTSQTLRSRLGAGYWSDALAAVGITASSRGRARGLLLFETSDYRDALVHFFAHCDATGSARSYASYERWLQNEDRAGRQWPSGPSVRQHFGSWTIAKRHAVAEEGLDVRSRADGGALASPARTALHDASMARREFLERMPQLPGRERSGAVTQFVKDFMGTYEARRRQWFRAIVSSDPEAIPRRLSSTPSLKPAHRELLTAEPPDLDAVLTDMYLDNLLAGKDGHRTPEQWLADEVRAELDVIGERDAAASAVLRELRNYFTHDSEESKRRVASTLADLGRWDTGFLMNGAITRRTLAAWLSSGDCERLVILTEAILASWRAMLAADAIAAG